MGRVYDYRNNSQEPIVIDLSAGDSNSDFFPLEGYSVGSMQVIWSGVTGTPDATFEVQTSDSNGAAWDDKSGTTITMSGASGSNSLSFGSGVLNSQAIRIKTTVNNATGGSASVYITRKG